MDIIGSLKRFWERDMLGNTWVSVGSGDTNWKLGDKLEVMLENPVTFSCVNLLADLFSQFKPLIGGDEKPDNDLVKLLYNPNPLQSKQDFLKEFIYFKTAEGWVFQYPMAGVGIKKASALYNLNPAKVSYDKEFSTRFLFESEAKELKKRQFKYEEDHLKRTFDINEVIPFFDIANGLSNDFLLKSPSRLKTVQRNIRNINAAFDAKYNGITKAGRYIVSGSKQGNITPRPLTAEEKRDIEGSMGGYGLGSKKGDITVTNSQVEVHELSVQLKNLGLDEAVLNDAMMIINVMRTPMELFILSLSGSTYENQKTAVINYIQNVVQNHVDDYCNSLNSFYGLEGKNQLSGTLEHLSVMQYIEEMKADKALKLSTAIRNLTGTNIDPNQFLESVGINLENG